MLLRLAAHDAESWVASTRDTPEGADRTDGPSLERGPRVQSLFVDRAGTRPRTVTCWAPVALIQSRGGPSEIIAFEPVIHPELSPAEETPVSARLRRWVVDKDPEIWHALEVRASEHAVQLSVVLSMLHVTEEDVDKDIADHLDHLRRSLPIPVRLEVSGDQCSRPNFARPIAGSCYRNAITA